MKRILALLLVLITMLSLVACGKDAPPTDAPAATAPATTAPAATEPAATEPAEDNSADEAAASEAVRLINAIGNVTVNSEAAIKEARGAFNALSGTAQGFVTNVDVLVAAEGAFITAKSEQVMAVIDAIGEVTLESSDAINAAAEAYNACDPDVQLAVTNANILEEAKKTFNGLLAADVDAKITAIGKVTLKKEEQINAAETAYNALSEDAKALVTGKETLDAAKTKFAELQKDKVLGDMKKKTDKVQGITWYMAKAEPKYADTRSYVLPYIGVQGSYAWLRLRYHYTGDDWVFFENVTIVVDGEKYYRPFSYFDVERDNQYGNVWEWVDVAPSNADIEMLKAIADSKETIVRFSGDVYHKDLKVKDKDKQAIKTVLAAYEYLK